MPETDRLECPLHAAAVSDPARPALEAPERQLSYRELDEWVQGTAAQLRESGSGPVALWMENDWRMVVLLLAAIRAGVAACPLSTRLPRVDEALEQVGVRSTHGARLISDRTGTPPDHVLQRAAVDGGVLHPPDQPATIVYTSGSTGRARAALLTFGNHYYSAAGSNTNIAVAPGDRWLVSLPLYHVGGIAILFRCLIGRAIIVVSGDRPLADAAADATHLSLVSTQLLRLLRADRPLPGLKAVLLGGSAIPKGLIDEAVARGLPIHTSYGLTEMASQVTTTPRGASKEELSSSGRLLPHRELRLSAEGEIFVRGRTRFAGYVDGSALDEPFDDDGWFATGDLGRLEGEVLHIIGRRDNLFISGGENVMPEEIEQALTTLPGIRRAVVVPVDDAEFGRRPVAFVDTGEDPLDPAKIVEQLENRLPRFKIPVRLFVWPKRDDVSGMTVDRAAFQREADKLLAG